MREKQLKEVFPSLYRLASSKYTTVLICWKKEEVEASGWCNSEDPSKIRKQRELTQFLKLTYLVRVSNEGDNISVWNENRKGSFNVILCVLRLVWISQPKKFRDLKLPKECVFSLSNMGEDLNCRQKGWTMLNRCNLCKKNEDLANHILIHCVRIGTLLLAVFSLK